MDNNAFGINLLSGGLSTPDNAWGLTILDFPGRTGPTGPTGPAGPTGAVGTALASVQRYTWSAGHTMNVGDPAYTIATDTLVFSSGATATQIGSTGVIQINMSGVYLVNHKCPAMYAGGVLTNTRNYGSSILQNGTAVSRTASALWGGFTCYLDGTAVLSMNAGDTCAIRIPTISVGQDGPLWLGNGIGSEFSFVKLA